MGVHEAPEEFCRRSLSEGWIPKIGRLTGVLERSPGVTWVRTRVVSHVQYDLRGLGMHLHGEEAAENAYHGEVLGDSRWLLQSLLLSIRSQTDALAASSASSTES